VLQSWAERVHLFLEQGFDVYGYFNNHFAGHSPASARQFAEIMGIEIKPAGGTEGRSAQLNLDL
jgi:uncharacterized protein YecE (DUF72 family)